MSLEERARGLLREPLVHFLLGGLAIFAFFAWQGEPADPASRTITITPEIRAAIALGFERTMQRPPSDAELDALVESHVREEVLYREALRLGLDRDDPVVRRRLAKKMDFLAAAAAETAEPSDEERAAWYRAQAARYTTGARASFDQVYFTRQADAAAMRAQIARNWQAAGEPSSLPRSATSRTRADIAAQFGEGFAEALFALEAGAGWQGPIRSGLGWHFVRLRGREAGRLPPLAEQRARVLADWRQATAERRREEAFELLRENYRVEIAR